MKSYYIDNFAREPFELQNALNTADYVEATKLFCVKHNVTIDIYHLHKNIFLLNNGAEYCLVYE